MISEEQHSTGAAAISARRGMAPSGAGFSPRDDEGESSSSSVAVQLHFDPREAMEWPCSFVRPGKHAINSGQLNNGHI
jgi:hypothetical protein